MTKILSRDISLSRTSRRGSEGLKSSLTQPIKVLMTKSNRVLRSGKSLRQQLV